MHPGFPHHALTSSGLFARRVLRVGAWVLVSLAVVSALAGGLDLHAGSIHLSATRPARLLVEALVLFITAHLLASPAMPGRAASRVPTLLLVFGLLAALTLDSAPRRVGDGAEYMAMAFQLGHGRPPALSPSDIREYSRALGADDGFKGLVPASGLTGSDGRSDTVHFWFYSLLAAPFVRAATVLGAHPNYGFAVLNLLALAIAGIVLARRVSSPMLIVLLTAPFVWWVDKAHTEVFSVAALTVAVLLVEDQPWWAVLALGVAATQNPAFVPPVILFATFAATRGAWRKRAFVAALGIAFALCALPFAYYRWHLGRWSPLLSTVTRQVPGMTALITPLVDPNLGIFVFDPALALLAVFGLAVALRRRETAILSTAWPILVSAAVFMFGFAQTPNVNHGATFNPSRYGLWLIPLTIPLLRAGEARLGRGRRATMTALAVFSVIWCCYVYAPRWSDNSGDLTTAARLLCMRAPSWYNPLPEVFAERVGTGDGTAMLPVATPGCTKVLLVGDGTTRPPWPIPCAPRAVPAACRAAGALCYANGSQGDYRFAVAPRQPGFSYMAAGGWTWKDTSDPALHRLLDRLGTSDVQPLPAGKPDAFIREALNVHWIRAWQGNRALIAWLPPSAASGRLRIRVPAAATALWIDQPGDQEIGRVDLPPATDAWLSVPNAAAPVLLITMASPRAGR